ncbi:unnamed protein product, partial [Amoebophrya sp. A25]
PQYCEKIGASSRRGSALVNLQNLNQQHQSGVGIGSSRQLGRGSVQLGGGGGAPSSSCLSQHCHSLSQNELNSSATST